MDCGDAFPGTDGELQRRLDESETDRGPDDASQIETRFDQFSAHLSFQDRFNDGSVGFLLGVQRRQLPTRLGLGCRAILWSLRYDLAEFILHFLDLLPALHVGAHQFDLLLSGQSVQPNARARPEHLAQGAYLPRGEVEAGQGARGLESREPAPGANSARCYPPDSESNDGNGVPGSPPQTTCG